MTDDPRISDDSDRARIDDSYRALGRYIYEFSRLVWHMRMYLSEVLTEGGPPGRYGLAEMTLGESTAQPIANAFFGVTRKVGELTPDELKVAKALRKQVNEAIKRRNDFAHGDWYIGWKRILADGTIPEDSNETRMQRIRPSFSGDTYPDYSDHVTDTLLRPADVDAFSDELESLRDQIAEYGALSTGMTNDPGLSSHRVGDVYIVQNGVVVRGGPKAGDVRATRHL